MSEVDYKTELPKLGFKPLGSGWYGNERDDVRIRVWHDFEVDFWLWRSSSDTNDNQIHFRGKIHSIEDIKWVLERCFFDQID